MENILVISGHTDLKDSVANKGILNELKENNENLEIRYLDVLYPDYKIDYLLEQSYLEKADVIILQFPVFWYGMPSLMNKWMEDTFQHGWSHGSTGDKLKGKSLIVSLTTGAPEALYHENAAMGHEIKDYLVPIQTTCHMCGMNYIGYVYTGGVSYQSRQSADAVKEIEEKAKLHAQRLTKMIKDNCE